METIAFWGERREDSSSESSRSDSTSHTSKTNPRDVVVSVEELDAHNRRESRNRGGVTGRPTLLRLGKKGVDPDATTISMARGSDPRGSSDDDISSCPSDLEP